jgi:hypothetical protein
MTSKLQPKVGDYVIATFRDDKDSSPFLCKVDKLRDGGAYKTTVQYDRYLPSSDDKYLTIKDSDLLAVLGSDISYGGQAFGIDLDNVYVKTREHSLWGPVHVCTTQMQSGWFKWLRSSMDHTARRIEKAGLKDLGSKFETEIRAEHGKYSGTYKHAGTRGEDDFNSEAYTDLLTIYARHDHSVDSMDYVLYHEFGHAVQFNLLSTTNIFSKWVNLYCSTVNLKPIDVKDFARVRKSLVKAYKTDHVQSIGQYARTIKEDESETLVFRTALRLIRQTHKVGVQELNALLDKDIEQFTNLWPQHDLDVSELDPVISDYSTKSVHEFFAEAFAFYMVGKKLPKRVIKLMEHSLSIAKDVLRGSKNGSKSNA